MEEFVLLATPWWVNLFVFIPLVAWYVWKKHGGPTMSTRVLMLAGLFGIAFGFVEAAVVVYLRAAVGLLPEYGSALIEVATSSSTLYRQTDALGALPQRLLTIEFYREAATVVMLVTIALLATKRPRNRFAVFLWIFAIWDIFYYAGLWVTVRWPYSLFTQDVLFLIPTPWLAQVWFPLLVSVLTLAAVVATRSK